MENSSEYPKIYKGKYWDLVVKNPFADHPERFQKELDPEYQQKEYDRIIADIKKRYGRALEQLKYL